MKIPWDEKTINEARERVREHFWLYYKVKLEDLEITSVPGYWQDKEAKKHIGGKPFKATYKYLDPSRDEKGRFASPYRTWRILFEAEQRR